MAWLQISGFRWHQEAWLIVALVVLILISGTLTEGWYSSIILAGAAYLGWHLYNIYRLNCWLAHPKKSMLPEAVGIWGEIFDRCYRLHQNNRKRKRKLSTMLKRVRRFTAAMPDASIILSPEQEIEWFNKAARKLLGLQSPQDIGQSITNLIRYPSFQAYLKDIQSTDSLKIVSPLSPSMMLRINIVPYAGNRYLMLARDVTQLHCLEQVRRDFVANVSHELRTPLTVITGFLETLSDSEEECAQHWARPLLLMSQQAARMRNIVEDLLLLSRLEGENSIHATEPVMVAELLQEIQHEAQLLSQEHGHTFTLSADPDLVIAGKHEELRSAFSNLVFNAVRYTPEAGQICLYWYRDEAGAHFAVSDTGEGIALEHIPRLTERFYRVDVGRSRSQGGTGLGLAIVKHVLNRHGAQLHIESVVDQGSTFRCDFPPQLICTFEWD